MKNRIAELKEFAFDSEISLKDPAIYSDSELVDLLNSELEKVKTELSILEIKPRKLISVRSKEESELQEVVDSLGKIKENLEAISDGEHDKDFAWETIELMFEFKKYFSFSQMEIPSTPKTLFACVDDLLFDYKGLTYSYWVVDEYGDSGILSKRIEELND